MLWVVAPYVAEMLHLKSLTINRVAGVAGFQTMSTCKLHIKPLNINMVVGVFDGFLSNALKAPWPLRSHVAAAGDGRAPIARAQRVVECGDRSPLFCQGAARASTGETGRHVSQFLEQPP